MIKLKTGFYCRICRQRHSTLPLSFSCKAPLAVTAIPTRQVDSRVVITPEQCVIDDRHFFLRGRIVVPIRGCDKPFVWGVWAQVSAKNFYCSYKGWSTAGRENEPPFEGRLANDLFFFGGPPGLALEVHTQAVGRRPHFVVSSTSHAIGREQREGITLARAEEIAASLLHPTAQSFAPAIFAL
ncbi:MAG: DUF2199 domain-containing protein [Acidobacteriaceae bacterium]